MRTKPDTTPSEDDVIDNIRTTLDEKYELTDAEMHALRIWTDHQTTERIPVLKTSRDNVPVTWALYDISDITNGTTYLALETHTKQQGDRYTRPYATGLGNPSFEPAGAPDPETLRDTITNVTERRNVEQPSENALTTLLDELERADREYGQLALEENVWAAAYDGTTVYVEPAVSPWDGFKHIFDTLNLTEPQREAIKEAGMWTNYPGHLDINTNFSFAADISLTN